MRSAFVAVCTGLLITIGLSDLAVHTSSQQRVYAGVIRHPGFWLVFRAGLILGFIGAWPYWVKRQAKRYHWHKAYVCYSVHQRWRFAIWLIIVDLAFQLL